MGEGSGVRSLAGKTGLLAAVLADYGGFEPVQRVIVAAVVDGEPLDPALAARIAQLPASDAPPFADPPWSTMLDEALEEATFVDQREVEAGEQRHFEQALGQLERFVADKILVCRRERAGLVEKLRAAHTRRDEVVGASAREKIEAEIARLATREEELERRIDALESREDEVYRRWRNEYHDLRYRAPKVTRLFQVAFRITAPKPLTSC